MRKLVVIVFITIVATTGTCSYGPGGFGRIDRVMVGGQEITSEADVDCSVYDCNDPRIIEVTRKEN